LAEPHRRRDLEHAVAVTARPLVRRFLVGLCWRVLAEAVIERLRRRHATPVADPLMLALWAVSLVVLPTYWAVFGWWVATGRGPGGWLFAFSLGGPRQRAVRRSPGRADDGW
jgi:hypothetical protein